MNFLAHLALAGTSEESRIGNLLGDFEKGTAAALRERLPEPIVAGILMHRQIDAATDSHASFRACKALLPADQRRFGGIVIDIFFDHFLSLHWKRFHDGTTAEFIAENYELLQRRSDLLGEQFRPLVPRIIAQDWLGSYATEEGIALTLDRVASRSPRLAKVRETFGPFIENKASFEAEFLKLYPDLQNVAKKLR